MFADATVATTLIGRQLPSIELQGADNRSCNLSSLTGLNVIYVFPRISGPDGPLIPGWEQVPGAKGCTVQSCAFRDHYGDLRKAGVNNVFGISAQDTASLARAVRQLRLPFRLLSDCEMDLARNPGLQTFQVGSHVLYRRITLITKGRIVRHAIIPGQDTALNPTQILQWIAGQECSA